jgi:hypothetical protein
MKIEGLSKLELIALAKIVSDDDVREASRVLTSGEYGVDFMVRVSGNIKRGENYTAKIVAKADPWLLLAAALSHLNGITVESIVREALAADPALVESLKVKAADAISTLKGTTETPCNGRVTTKLVCAKAA